MNTKGIYSVLYLLKNVLKIKSKSELKAGLH